MDDRSRAQTAATLREIAVLISAMAMERHKLHEGCGNPDCTPRLVFEEYCNQGKFG
jgi:hypothetical protein